MDQFNFRFVHLINEKKNKNSKLSCSIEVLVNYFHTPTHCATCWINVCEVRPPTIKNTFQNNCNLIFLICNYL
jgi:hypothetical protein